MKKLDFLEMCNIYYKSRNELLHGGYCGEFLERTCLEQIFKEMKITDKNIQSNLVSFFNLGTIANI